MTDATLIEIIESLRETYEEDGVAIWLSHEHASGPLHGSVPIRLCRTAFGRVRVLAAAAML